MALEKGSSVARQFLCEDWHAQIAGLYTLDDAEFQHLHDLLHGCTCFESALNVAAHTGRIEVGVGRVKREVDELDLFRRERAFAHVLKKACG